VRYKYFRVSLDIFDLRWSKSMIRDDLSQRPHHRNLKVQQRPSDPKYKEKQAEKKRKITALYPSCGFQMPINASSRLEQPCTIRAFPLLRPYFFGQSPAAPSSYHLRLGTMIVPLGLRKNIWHMRDLCGLCQQYILGLVNSHTRHVVTDGWLQSQLRENKTEEDCSKQCFSVGSVRFKLCL